MDKTILLRSGALLVLSLALVVVAGMGGLRLLQVLGVAGALVASLGIAYSLFTLSPAGWIVRARQEVKRITAGQSEAVIADYRPLYEQGDQSPQTILVLWIAYLHIGQVQEAARFATNARAILDHEKVCEKRDRSSRTLCYIIQLGLADMAIAEGRFAEAARALADYLPHSMNKPFVATAAAVAFFLADDAANTRAMLDQAPHPGQRTRPARSGGPHYRLMVAYIRSKVLGEDTRAIMRQCRGEIAYWRDETARSGGAAYRQRMTTILDEIEALLA